MGSYKAITINRRAKHDYDIAETMLTGLVLIGTEVKSVRNGRADLKGSFASLKNDELWLNNAHIPAWQIQEASKSFDPTRTRKILIHKRELKKITAAKQNGQSFIPISIGLQHGFIKLELGLGKGRKKYDKRESIKKRSAAREASGRVKRSAK